MTDLVIVGAGPSALTAGIYAAREGLSVRVFEKSAFGGLMSSTDFIENYPGFELGISGEELSKKMRLQAEKFGVVFDYGEVSDIEELEDCVRMKIDGEEFESKTILLAVGNSYRTLGLPMEDEFFGRGIHFCATCDGPIYAGKELIVVGGGNSAVQESIFLSRTSKVNLLVRNEITAQDVLKNKLFELEKEGKINIYLGAEISEFIIDGRENSEKISGVKVVQGESRFEIHASAVFEFIGLIPNTDFLKNSNISLNDFGEIMVDEKMRTLNSKRIFACGDVIEGAEKQIVVAAGSGAKAGMEISRFIHS